MKTVSLVGLRLKMNTTESPVDCVITIKCRAEVFRVQFLHVGESIQAVLVRAGIEGRNLNVICNGKRIGDLTQGIGGLCSHGTPPTLMVMGDVHFKARDITSSHSPRPQDMTELSTLNPIMPLTIGDASEPVSSRVSVRDGSLRFFITVHGSSLRISDLIRTLSVALNTPCIELIGKGKVFQSDSTICISDSGATEFMLRRTAAFWEALEVARVLEADAKLALDLESQLSRAIKSITLDRESASVHIAHIHQQLELIKYNIELYTGKGSTSSATVSLVNRLLGEIKRLARG